MSLTVNVGCDRCVLVISPTLAYAVRCNVKSALHVYSVKANES